MVSDDSYIEAGQLNEVVVTIEYEILEMRRQTSAQRSSRWLLWFIKSSNIDVLTLYTIGVKLHKRKVSERWANDIHTSHSKQRTFASFRRQRVLSRHRFC